MAWVQAGLLCQLKGVEHDLGCALQMMQCIQSLALGGANMPVMGRHSQQITDVCRAVKAKVRLNGLFADDCIGFRHAVQNLAGLVASYLFIDGFPQRHQVIGARCQNDQMAGGFQHPCKRIPVNPGKDADHQVGTVIRQW